MFAGALAIISLVLGVMYFNRPSTETRAVRLSFNPPPNLSFNDAQADTVIVSPDGQKLAFTASAPNGKRQLWVRPLNSLDAQPLPGTDEASEPFWSSDSRSIAFGAQGKLKRVDLAGGSSQVLCDATRLTGGAWSSKGVIVFGSDFSSALFQIPATGGEPKPVTLKDTARGDNQHVQPVFLPDGKHFLFKIGPNKGVWVGSLDSTEIKQVLPDANDAAYAPPGWLLFVRNQALLTQAFDADRLELKGEAMPIVSQPTNSLRGDGLSISENGVLVWQGTWEREYQLAWFDRAGNQVGAVGTPIKLLGASGQEPHLSPDGKRVAIRRDGNIWVIDLSRGNGIRLTAITGQLPIWSPDGSHVAYTSTTEEGRRAGPGIIQKAANGVGNAETLLKGTNFPADWSSDGRFILFYRRGEKTRMDLWALPLFGDKQEYPLLNSAFEERNARLSPDGRWLAYSSDESGSYEIYVQSFTADGKVGGDKKLISTHGGTQPIWRGPELFYVTEDGQMMSVAVKTSGAEFEYSTPKTLFKTRMLARSLQYHEYDVTADGQRFLVGTLIGEPKSLPPTVILNWLAEMKK
jgi:Tol biopolymer transport system component